jgi:hypothetical protein
MHGRVTSLESSKQQHHEPDQQKDVYQVACVVQAQYARQPDREYEERGLQEHVASQASLVTLVELQETAAELRRETLPGTASS